MRRLLAVRDARVYLTGQVFSLFGDTALWLAMGIWVKTLTGSNAAAGLVFFFANVPVLLTPLTGLLVDRVRRRPLLIAVNALTGAAVLLLLLVHGRGQVWLVYLVMTWYGLSYSVLAAAQSALLTIVLPAGLLADANGALRTVQESLRLAGPLTGAGLFVLGGGHVVAILDAATFAVPVVSLLMLRVREPAPQPRRSHWRTELTAGLRHVVRTPALRHLVIAAACALTVFGFTETVIYAVAGDGLHRPPAFVGALIAIQGVGAVVGGPTAAPLIRRIGERPAGRAGHAGGGGRGPAGDAAVPAVGGGRRHPVRGQRPLAVSRLHHLAAAADPAGPAGPGLRRGRHPGHHPADHLHRGPRRPDRRHRLPAVAGRAGRRRHPGRGLPAHPPRAAPGGSTSS